MENISKKKLGLLALFSNEIKYESESLSAGPRSLNNLPRNILKNPNWKR